MAKCGTIIVVVLCVLGSQGRPSLSFNLPSAFVGFGSTKEPRVSPKMYSGRRLRMDSIRMVYVNDQTVAVVELGPKKLLLNCELIEIFEPDQVMQAIGELHSVTRPITITFSEMLNLMDQCKQLDDMVSYTLHDEKNKNHTGPHRSRGLLNNNPFTLLSGIIPGTKWCGTGDIARDYYDLGIDMKVDTCCRAHDLCPVKIRAYSQRYNLTNQSLYTKSHCKCDDALFECLKKEQSPSARIMGNIYFNLVQVPCVQDSSSVESREFRGARRNF